eukprot:1136694-Pelagomonas_calceolata.AAC.6
MSSIQHLFSAACGGAGSRQQCAQQCAQQCIQQCTQQCCADGAFLLACALWHAPVLSKRLRQFFSIASDASLTCLNACSRTWHA